MRCSKCGAENPDRAKFCVQCASPCARRCPSCTAENPPTAKFCLECAKPLDGTSGKSQGAAAASSPIRLNAGTTDASPDGERKVVTFLFADIKGSMDLIEDLDPEEARTIRPRSELRTLPLGDLSILLLLVRLRRSRP